MDLGPVGCRLGAIPAVAPSVAAQSCRDAGLPEVSSELEIMRMRRASRAGWAEPFFSALCRFDADEVLSLFSPAVQEAVRRSRSSSR